MDGMNVGGIDRLIRTAVGVVLFFGPLLGFWEQYRGVSMIFGAIMMATGLSGMCPPYALLGINTCKRDVKKESH